MNNKKVLKWTLIVIGGIIIPGSSLILAGYLIKKYLNKEKEDVSTQDS